MRIQNVLKTIDIYLLEGVAGIISPIAPLTAARMLLNATKKQVSLYEEKLKTASTSDLPRLQANLYGSTLLIGCLEDTLLLLEKEENK